MQMLKYFLILFVLWSAACSQQKHKQAEKVIPLQKMQLILEDIHIADGIANRQNASDEETRKITQMLYDEVFKKHGVSEKQFFESFQYYLFHAELLDSMYNHIIVEISKKQALQQAR
jgi:hypothetical protein